MTKGRFIELDIYKGIAILFVMLFHSICSFPIELNNFYGLKYFIAVFHMNMFFWVSGLLLKESESWIDFLKKKIWRICIPWLVFTIASIILRIVASSITRGQVNGFFDEFKLALVNGKYYWFLYVLLLMMIITKVAKNKHIIALVGGQFSIIFNRR